MEAVDGDLHDLIDYQLKQGVAVSTVSDGTLVFLSVDAMRKLLAKAEEAGQDRIVIFAQKPKLA